MLPDQGPAKALEETSGTEPVAYRRTGEPPEVTWQHWMSGESVLDFIIPIA